MKKFLQLVVVNGILFGALFITGFFFPEYAWTIKAILYILLPLGIIACIGFQMNMEDYLNDPYFLEKIKSTSFQIIDYSIDLMFLILLAILNYKILFVLYFFLILFQIGFREKLKKELKEKKRY